MSVFRRRRRGDPDGGADGAADGVDEGAATEGTAVGDDRSGSADAAVVGSWRENGPWDISEVPDPGAGGRVDLGGMWLPGRPGLEVRIEADQASSVVVAVTLVLPEGALQVQPFAAPRTGTIWDEVRAEIRAGITQQGGTATEVTGPTGAELRTRVPVRSQDGSSGVQPARFIGIDGPRWFLRGVLTGRVAVEDGVDEALIEIFRDIVVVRGAAPMAPRDPIPLALPAPGAEVPEEVPDGQRTDGDLQPFERGPEITEIH